MHFNLVFSCIKFKQFRDIMINEVRSENLTTTTYNLRPNEVIKGAVILTITYLTPSIQDWA